MVGSSLYRTRSCVPCKVVAPELIGDPLLLKVMLNHISGRLKKKIPNCPGTRVDPVLSFGVVCF